MTSTAAPAAVSVAPFCDPLSHEPLWADRTVADGATVLQTPSGRCFPIRDQIAIFIEPSDVTGLNLWQQRFYDRLAPWYDLASAVHVRVSRAARRWREEYLEELAVPAGSRVLEVSVGTGANIVRLPPVEYFGLDLSWGMLKQCRRKLRGRTGVTLCQGLAERLPFEDNAFDVVFHVGAINHFVEKRRALAEMVRVARPDARLLVVDATEQFASRYRSTPILRALYSRLPSAACVPEQLLPEDVRDVRVRTIADGELYCLSFAKRATMR